MPFDQFNLPTFRIDAFPKWLRDFVSAEATATQTPVDLGAMLALPAAGAACAKKRVLLPAQVQRLKNGLSQS